LISRQKDFSFGARETQTFVWFCRSADFKHLVLVFVLAALLTICLAACGETKKAATVSTPTPSPTLTAAPASSPASPEDAATEQTIRFLEARVRRDPEDYIALNKLAGYYILRLRETGGVQYLELAMRAAQMSLKAMPAEQNRGGLLALAQSKFAAHDFTGARDDAERLVELEPDKTYPYLFLGDALLELGDYDRAQESFRQMERRAFEGDINVETRRARLAVLRGNEKDAVQHLTRALNFARNSASAGRETVAWIQWQLGDIAFQTGDYQTAERQSRDALQTFPDYYRALGLLARALAAKGDAAGAIENYERAIKRLPDPVFIAALGDLYKLAGRDADAAQQYALVESIAHLSALNGQLYNRNLALFYADHDMRADEAYQLAAKEFEARRDIYGTDALAWTALKAGKIDEASAKIKDALRLGTKDARLFYHAGMIARAAGDMDAARKFLKQTLALNAQFDPMQSKFARDALEK
jgi:tetratricopeptide (TPR) repeat protein